MREFRPGDNAQFLDLVRDLQAFEIEIHDRMMPVDDIGEWYIARLLQRCVSDRGFLLVAENGDDLLGYAAVFTAVAHAEIDEVPYTYGEISHIAVKPSARGTGAGKLLLAECERLSRAAGQRWLRLNVFAQNHAARAVYEHMGFRQHLVVMEKPLP